MISKEQQEQINILIAKRLNIRSPIFKIAFEGKIKTRKEFKQTNFSEEELLKVHEFALQLPSHKGKTHKRYLIREILLHHSCPMELVEKYRNDKDWSMRMVALLRQHSRDEGAQIGLFDPDRRVFWACVREVDPSTFERFCNDGLDLPGNNHAYIEVCMKQAKENPVLGLTSPYLHIRNLTKKLIQKPHFKPQDSQ